MRYLFPGVRFRDFLRRLLRGNALEAAPGNIRAGFPQKPQEIRDHAGIHRIIRIQKSDVSAFCSQCPAVSGNRYAEIFLMKGFYDPPFPHGGRCKRVRKLSASVRGAVVDQDNLQLVIGL